MELGAIREIHAFFPCPLRPKSRPAPGGERHIPVLSLRRKIMPNMDEETKPKRWPFIIQLPSLCVAPIALLGRSLPLTAEMKLLGALCYVLVFFFAFPAGLIALIYMKKHAGALGSLEKPTKVLAIINMLLGMLVVAPLLILFLAVLANVRV